MSIKKVPFDTLKDGRVAYKYTLTNSSGAEVDITNYGGYIIAIRVPDRDGALADVVLSNANIADLSVGGFMGALVGRYANRIAHGRFTLNGKTYQLAVNEKGKHHLHGGNIGFDKKLWDVEEIPGEGIDALELSLESPDGEENYPGTLDILVTYTWDDECGLTIMYSAETDTDTIVNLTNHAYFNLAGHDSGTHENHIITINADKFTVVDADCIPTGELRDVTGTPFDLRRGIRIGDGQAKESTDEQLKNGAGYDHNFVLCAETDGDLTLAATAFDPSSGRVMRVYTDMPGIQFYGGNMIGSTPGKHGKPYVRRGGLCLETQFFPDTPNQPSFPGAYLKAGQPYDFTTIYAFSVE